MLGKSLLFTRNETQVELSKDEKDHLAEQLENLTLIIKKKTEEEAPVNFRSQRYQYVLQTCSYCNGSSQGAADCYGNPRKHTICRRSRRYGHPEATRYSNIIVKPRDR